MQWSVSTLESWPFTAEERLDDEKMESNLRVLDSRITSEPLG